MNKHEIEIDIFGQRLYLRYGSRIVKSYPVSTSRYGAGNRSGSSKTPLGTHRIVSKIGRNARLGVIFKKRRDTKKFVKIGGGNQDLITTRILRLEGLEKGINKGKGIDLFQRCIYIHGTAEESLIGRPAS